METLLALAKNTLRWMGRAPQGFKRSTPKVCLDMFLLVQKIMISLVLLMDPKPASSAEEIEMMLTWLYLPRNPLSSHQKQSLAEECAEADESRQSDSSESSVFCQTNSM